MKKRKEKSKTKNYLDKFWFLLWKDDSPKGWIFSIIFLFIFIKFIFFPILSLITGTALPLAIVESCSMYHDGAIIPFTDYNQWWIKHTSKYEDFDLTQEQFKGFKFHNGFNKGDILFVIGTKPEKLRVGDVIIFNAQQRNPVIHRIINIQESNGQYTFSTIGDNNNGQISFEKSILEEQIVGKAVFKIAPYLGWGKLIFFEHLKSESEKGFCDEN